MDARRGLWRRDDLHAGRHRLSRPRSIIETEPPPIAAEKLMALMEAEGLTFDDLRRRARPLQGVRVHVVGDTIVDTYTHCTLIGGMTKTPTFSVRFDEQQRLRRRGRDRRQASRGGGRRCDVLDRARRRPARGLRRSRIWPTPGSSATPIVDPTRPTTQQERLHRRRLPDAQGRHGRQPVDLRADPRAMLAEQIRDTRRRTSSCSATSATASSTATPFRTLTDGDPERAPSASPTARSPAAGATSSNSRAST